MAGTRQSGSGRKRQAVLLAASALSPTAHRHRNATGLTFSPVRQFFENKQQAFCGDGSAAAFRAALFFERDGRQFPSARASGMNPQDRGNKIEFLRDGVKWQPKLQTPQATPPARERVVHRQMNWRS